MSAKHEQRVEIAILALFLGIGLITGGLTGVVGALIGYVCSVGAVLWLLIFDRAEHPADAERVGQQWRARGGGP